MSNLLRRLKARVNSFSCCKGLSSDDVSSIAECSLSAIDCSADRCSPVPLWRCPPPSERSDYTPGSPRSPFTPLPPIPKVCRLTGHLPPLQAPPELPGCLDLEPLSIAYLPSVPLPQIRQRTNYASAYLPPLPELSNSDCDSCASSSSSEGSLFTYSTPFNRSQSQVSIGNSPLFEDDLVSSENLVDDLLNFRKASYLEKRKRKPLTHLVGGHNQMTVNGVYSGSQCTVTALNAIVYHHFKNMAFWNKTTLDNIVRNGDYHHTLFRDVFHYSRNRDGRIALDELPSTVKFNYDQPQNPLSANAYVGESSGLVFLGQTGMTKDLKRPTLKRFLKRKIENLNDAYFLITVNEHTYSAAKNNAGQWFIFDSHGSLKVSKAIIGKTEKRPTADCLTGATLTRFPKLSVLMQTLKKNHGAGTPCEARLVTVIPRLDLSFTDDEKKPKSKIVNNCMAEPTATKKSKSTADHKPAPTYTVRTRSNKAQFFTAPPISDGSAEDVSDDDVIML